MSYSIILKDYANVRNEKVANVAITPGELLELMSTDKVKPHATAGGAVTPVMFALEDELQGNGITDDYAVSAPVQIITARPGDEIQAILADGQNIAIGAKLESAGDGSLQAHVSDDSDDVNIGNQIVGIASEAIDTSPSSAVASGDSGLGFKKRINIIVV